MNQTCKVCGEPAAGFHFGAFTCEGCKSFFGRSYNNLSSISECKNQGKCIIDKKNRTTCKACRLRKCYNVGMSKGGSRYGRRSNWFKIHCLLQEQQQKAVEASGRSGHGFGDDINAAAAAAVAAAQGSSLGSHMGMLAYSPYLPDMMSSADAFKNSFHSQFLPHHPDAVIAAAAADYHHQQLQQRQQSTSPSAAVSPFFMMNPLPISSRSVFQLPSHLLFPSAGAPGSYHASSAFHRAEKIFKQRQSVDSSSESSNHWNESSSPEAEVPIDTIYAPKSSTPADIQDRSKTHLPVQISQIPEIPQTHEKQPTASNTCSPVPPSPSIPIASPSQPLEEYPNRHQRHNDETTYQPKPIQAESPVSVCSVHDQEQVIPIDLSMKASSSRSVSRAAASPATVPAENQSSISGGESDIQSEASEEEIRLVQSVERRKFYHLSEHESDASSDAAESVKRQKLSEQTYNYTSTNPTSLRGIFVCV